MGFLKSGLHTTSFSMVELPFIHPWFLCEIKEYEEDTDSYNCITPCLISNLETLTDLAKTSKLGDTYLVSPAYMNNAGRWSMNRLLEISRAEYFHEERSNYVYRFYAEHDLSLDLDVSGLNQNKDNLNFVSILNLTEERDGRLSSQSS